MTIMVMMAFGVLVRPGKGRFVIAHRRPLTQPRLLSDMYFPTLTVERLAFRPKDRNPLLHRRRRVL